MWEDEKEAGGRQCWEERDKQAEMQVQESDGRVLLLIENASLMSRQQKAVMKERERKKETARPQVPK